MGLDVWFREDIQRALRASLTATIASHPPDDYLAGYGAAVATIAAAFGIEIAEVLPDGVRRRGVLNNQIISAELPRR